MRCEDEATNSRRFDGSKSGNDEIGSTNKNLNNSQFRQPKKSMDKSTYYLEWHPLFKPMPLPHVKLLKNAVVKKAKTLTKKAKFKP